MSIYVCVVCLSQGADERTAEGANGTWQGLVLQISPKLANSKLALLTHDLTC